MVPVTAGQLQLAGGVRHSCIVVELDFAGATTGSQRLTVLLRQPARRRVVLHGFCGLTYGSAL